MLETAWKTEYITLWRSTETRSQQAPEERERVLPQCQAMGGWPSSFAICFFIIAEEERATSPLISPANEFGRAIV